MGYKQYTGAYRPQKCPYCLSDDVSTWIDDEAGGCYTECAGCDAKGPLRKSPDWATESWNRVSAVMMGIWTK